MRNHAKLTAALLVLAVSAACGENFWSDLPTGSGGGTMPGAPRVDIAAPVSGQRVAARDSVFVTVRISDSDPIESVEFSGFSLRGSADLGTAEEVERYLKKQVSLVVSEVTDTVISRFLLPTTDSLTEDSVFIVARVSDAQGNVGTDTVAITIGGPRVQITSPAPEGSVRAGTSLSVGIRASDAAGRVQSLRLQAEGALTHDTTFAIDPTVSALDTTVTFAIPGGASGEAVLRASVITLANDSASSAPVSINVVPPIQDTQAPTVSYTVVAADLVEHDDSVRVTVQATDSTVVAGVGITVRPIHAPSSALITLRKTVAGEAGVFTFAVDELGVAVPTDSSTVAVEITAFAADTAGNCATATVSDTPLSERCVDSGGHTFGPRPGARWEMLLVRGLTVPLVGAADRIADIASDGANVFISNLTSNRLDVIPVGSLSISRSISVGSEPWGLAFDPNGDTLYVANSGGTNISVVSGADLQEVRRIQTPNVKLFDVSFDQTTWDVSSVTRHDYSDRPQFMAVTQNGNLIYSTRPTPAASDGTVRIYRPGDGSREGRLEIITDYVENRPEGKLLILNADSAFLLPGALIRVCPRARSADPAIDGTLSEQCFDGSVDAVEDTLTTLGYDTEFHYNKDVAEVGLTDTTFVAVSGDHSTVAFGEGVVDDARIMILVDSAGSSPSDPLYKHGETSDLIGNTAETVIGLALNADGSMGVARGDQAYYFARDLRLQGVVDTGIKSGGVAMHPDNPSVERSFVSGIAENGLAYIDVLDSYHFREVTRIFMRDPVTGPLRGVETASGMLIYAVTDHGIVVIEVLAQDL